MARKRSKRRSRRGSASFGSVAKLLTPVAVATLTEPFVDQVAASVPIPTIAGIQPDDLIKVAGGYFLRRQRGLVGDTAKMYMIFGARNIVKQLLGGGLAGLGMQPQQAQVYY